MLVLMLDIPSDDKLIDANTRHKVPSGPERLFFIQPMLNFYLFLEPSTTFAFDYLHGIGNAVFGVADEDKMNVIHLYIQF